MKYQEYLLLEKRSETINLEKAVDVYLSNCQNTPLNNYFVRAVKHAYDYVISNNGESETLRQSKSGDIISMLAVDHYMKKLVPNNTPLRQKALIMATQGNMKHLDKGMFGDERYYVIPYDGIPLAYCYYSDFNFSRKIYEPAQQIQKYVDKDQIKTFDNIIDKLNHQTLITPVELAKECDLSGSFSSFEDVLDKLYNFEEMDIHVTDDSNNLSRRAKFEVWTSGKCLLINAKNWNTFVYEVNKKKTDQ